MTGETVEILMIVRVAEIHVTCPPHEGRGDASCSNHPLVADAAFLILSRPLAYVRIGSLAVHMCEVGK